MVVRTYVSETFIISWQSCCFSSQEFDLMISEMDEGGMVEKKNEHDEKHGNDPWMNIGDDDVTTTSESSLGEFSTTSRGSTSSSDMVDDASSSTICNGPLYELSELMVQLPIKRGLSKYFQGKSESFTSLSSLKSIQELAKKETPYRKKMKACKSYAHRLYTLPRATISKKVARNSQSSLSFPSRRGSFLSGRPLIPVQKNL